MSFNKVFFLLSFSFLGLVSVSNAQNEIRKSPLGIAQYKFDGTYIKVTFGKPLKRGREVFGGIVPYNKIWRTGANEATEITFTRDIIMSGKRIAAGTYSIFTKPMPQKWMVYINSQLGLWGAYEYSPTKNVHEFEVPVQKSDTTEESFSIIMEGKGKEVKMILQWDKTYVVIPIVLI